MVTNIFHPPPPSVIGVLSTDCPERRKLQAELSGLKDLLVRGKRNDRFTQMAELWRDNFFHALRTNADVKVVQEEFIPLLKQLLKDPFENPLDEEAILGSDGITYSAKTYQIFLQNAPQDLQDRSPLHPEDPKVFTFQPDPIAIALAKWLNRYTTPPSSSEDAAGIFARFRQEAEGRARAIQEEVEEIGQQAEVTQERSERLSERVDRTQQQINQQAKLQRLQEKERQKQERRAQHRRDLTENLQQEEDKVSEELKKLRDLYRLLQERKEQNDQDEEALRCDLETARDQMQNKINETRGNINRNADGIHTLKTELGDTKIELEKVKRTHAEVRNLANEVSHALDKRDAEAKSGLAMTIGGIILGAIITYVSQGTVMAQPTDGGGIISIIFRGS